MQHDDRQAAKREREASRYAKADQEDLDAFVRAMFEARQGRKYALWLLEISNGMGLGEIFTTNALNTARLAGEHNVGKQIWAHMLDVAPDAFFKALKEQADERSARQQALGNSTSDDTDASGNDD